MADTMTDQERQEFLKGLGLSGQAAGLAVQMAPTDLARPADAGTDVRLIPAAEIVFDPAMLDRFENLDAQGMAAASRYLFDMYKSPGKNKERHALLHRRIGEFIQQVRRSRATDSEPVKEKIKATKETRDLAALLAEQGITAADLAAFIKTKGETA